MPVSIAGVAIANAASRWKIAATAVFFIAAFESQSFASAAPFSPGDVFVGTNDGKIQHLDRVTGSLIQILDTGINDSIGGICFDSDWNLYATLFNNDDKLAVFEPVGGTLVTNTFLVTPPPVGSFFKAEGCTVNSRDDIYIGHAGSLTTSPADIRRYDRAGNLQQVYTVGLTPTGGPGNTGNGPTFLDLHCDQCTMYYAENGPVIRRYDVCLDSQLGDFKTHTSWPPQRYFDLHVLPGSDEVLVADTGFVAGSSYSAVQHFDASAAPLNTFNGPTYFTGSHHKICVVDLDYLDGGESFWTAPQSTATEIKRIDISAPFSALQTFAVTSATALEVLNPYRCGCTDPPPDMAAWWTFDEDTGPTAFDIAGGHDGTHSPALGPPTPDDGMVEDSLRFDGANSHVLVPDAPELRFPTFTFTVDFWIHPDLGEIRGTVIRKGVPAAGGAAPMNLVGPGYHIFYQLGHFFIFFSGTASGYINDISDNFLYHADPEKWTHVAITVGPGTVPGFPTWPYKIDLWIDGVLAKQTPMPNVGDPSNFEPLVIGGSDFAGATADHGFDGRLDELEIFPRVLTQSEIQSIYLAGAAGKCKDDVHPPWDKAICVDDANQEDFVDVDIEICNYNPTSANYELGFKTLPVGASGIGGGCSVVGPPSFNDPGPGSYYPPPKPITVAAGKCKIEKVRLTKPVAFTDSSAVGKVGCYEVSLRNVATGHVKRMNGSVQATAGPCPVVIDNSGVAAQDVLVLVPGASRPVVIDLVDGSDQEAREMAVIVEPFDSDMSGGSAPLSINGAQPGEAWKHTVSLPGSQARVRANITLVVESNSREPFGFQDVIISADLDRETCGVEPLISLGFRSPLLSEFDLDGDGLTNDFEVAFGLSPYERNKRNDLVPVYALVLDDTVDCLKLFLTEYPILIEPQDSELIEAAVGLVAESITILEDNAFASVERVFSAVQALQETRDSRRVLQFERKGRRKPNLNGRKRPTLNGMKEVQPHIIALTAATGLFVDGLLQFLNAEGRDTTKATEQLQQGKEAEVNGDFYRAMGKYMRALKFERIIAGI